MSSLDKTAAGQWNNEQRITPSDTSVADGLEKLSVFVHMV